MSAPTIGLRPRYAPRPGASIDPSHPLAQGLAFAFAPGVGMRDLVSNVTPTRVASPSFATNRFGPSTTTIASPVTGLRFQVPDGPFLGPIAQVWVGRFNSMTGYNSLMSKCTSNGTGNSPFDLWVDSTGKFASNRSNSTVTPTSYGQVLSGTGVVTTNTDYVIVLNHPNVMFSAGELWVNGRKQTTTFAGSGTASAAGDGKPIGIGVRDDNLTSAFTVALVAIYSRWLSEGEVGQMYADPFCFLRW